MELWLAVDNDDVVEVRFLLGQGADPNHQLYWSREWGWREPPLHRACHWGYLETVKTLVTHGARTDKGNRRDTKTPLHYACWEGRIEVVKYLIQEVGCSTGKYCWYIYRLVLYKYTTISVLMAELYRCEG